MQAAGLFALGHDNAPIAKELRVSVRSAQRLHQAWEHGGASAFGVEGPASRHAAPARFQPPGPVPPGGGA
ncbi:hypothetical protein ACFZAV_21860 [Streptomyces sp. NPDC008343]|uniref:hypothetical protein n=1 Tax=Streptomyces sp. NPDC008343 TaxID=3364828 RepID=UPI0036EE57B3